MKGMRLDGGLCQGNGKKGLIHARAADRGRAGNGQGHRTDADGRRFQRLLHRPGEEGLDLGKLYDYDIILLDLNLPDMHGYDVLKKLRVAKVQTPVLILSGISEMDSKVRSFGFGADDYVTKPFHREELIARIHAVVRRSKGHSQSVIRTGKLSVNLDAKTVEVDAPACT
jgi:DNA-binding response OmpR family regulator